MVCVSFRLVQHRFILEEAGAEMVADREPFSISQTNGRNDTTELGSR